LADAGYWHGEQIDELMGQGVRVLIPPDADKRRGTRPGWDGGRYAFMRTSLTPPQPPSFTPRLVMAVMSAADRPGREAEGSLRPLPTSPPGPAPEAALRKGGSSQCKHVGEPHATTGVGR
jgi:hypothetical protein